MNVQGNRGEIRAVSCLTKESGEIQSVVWSYSMGFFVTKRSKLVPDTISCFSCDEHGRVRDHREDHAAVWKQAPPGLRGHEGTIELLGFVSDTIDVEYGE